MEALVSLRRAKSAAKTIGTRDTDFKKAGDILVVKLSPAVWGEAEMTDFLIAFLEDADLEADMKARKQTQRVYPYATFEEVDRGDGVMESKMVERSGDTVDLTLFEGTDGLDPKNKVGAVKMNDGKTMEKNKLKKKSQGVEV